MCLLLARSRTNIYDSNNDSVVVVVVVVVEIITHDDDDYMTTTINYSYNNHLLSLIK